VLNSKDFGVPQNRERVFIVGHLRGTDRPQVFPFGESSGKGLKQLGHTGERSDQGGRIYDTKGSARCLTSTPDHGSGNYTGLYQKDMKIRRLTPTECERLQGFPDGWTEGISDTQRYKCLGNAVTTNVVAEIGKRLI
jgi:site-specific DNA-cytosine methylase